MWSTQTSVNLKKKQGKTVYKQRRTVQKDRYTLYNQAIRDDGDNRNSEYNRPTDFINVHTDY